LDFIPDVREGDITLLNTKAEMFAPFVRRVALRVFQHQAILLRRELRGAYQGGRESVTLEAVMTGRGDLVSLEVKDHVAAVSLGADRNLRRACAEGFFDHNPPPGAEAADGRIHFLFRTDVAIYPGPNGHARGGIIFQAGLL